MSLLAGYLAWVARVHEEKAMLLESGAGYESRKAWVQRVRAERQEFWREYTRNDAAVFEVIARMVQIDHPERPLLEIRARLRDGDPDL